MSTDESAVARSELRWTAVVVAAIGVVFVAIVSATLAFHDQPPSHRETIDPTTMHLSGEFVEGNLGTSVGPDGGVTTRFVAAQFAFVPQCAVVPRGKPVTLRLASPDVIHGILVMGTNVNTMVVPGYVSEVHTVFAESGDYLMPCHEFCGLGHGEMMAHIRVVPASQFNPDKNGKVGCGLR
ncbi:MAG: cytochrome C oxidase subunit II [Alphaproteobacteria bacterium]